MEVEMGSRGHYKKAALARPTVARVEPYSPFFLLSPALTFLKNMQLTHDYSYNRRTLPSNFLFSPAIVVLVLASNRAVSVQNLLSPLRDYYSYWLF